MWFSKPIDEVFKELDVNPATGLSNQEVQARLEKYGINKLRGKAKKAYSVCSLNSSRIP